MFGRGRDDRKFDQLQREADQLDGGDYRGNQRAARTAHRRADQLRKRAENLPDVSDRALTRWNYPNPLNPHSFG